MKEFKFEYIVIIPKKETIKGREIIKSLFYWTAYWQLRNKLKKQHSINGTNVIIKLDFNYISI